MPDHIHLFCAPHNLDFTVEAWVKYLAGPVYTELHKNISWRFQSHGFHHRLRRQESYLEKWEYVRMNPVRLGLAKLLRLRIGNSLAWSTSYAGEMNTTRLNKKSGLSGSFALPL